MIGGAKAIEALIVAAAVFSMLITSAYSQGLGKKGGGYRGPPVENHPKVDEKAYHAVLERIPEPNQKYDPWSIARPSDSAKTGKKSD